MNPRLSFAFSISFAAATVGGLALLAGCGGSSPSPTGGGAGGATGLAAGGASSIYVVQQASSSSSVLVFPVTATGVATPSATLTPPAGVYITSVATDSSGQIYLGVVNNASSLGEVLVYPAGATGAATPTRTIVGATISAATATTFAMPRTITVGGNGVLYIASSTNSSSAPYSIAGMSATANGTATPVTFLTGLSTQIASVQGIAVDTANNLYISSSATGASSSILVFASGATGNVAPSRTITAPALFYGVAVDSASNIYTSEDNAGASTAGSIVEFAAGASGAATPSRTISGTASNIFYCGGLRVDSAGNIFAVNVANVSAATPTYSLLAFNPTASGNVAPTVSFTSASWNSAGSELALK